MKKILSLALSFMMCASVVVAAGCQESGSQSTPPPPAQAVENLQLEKNNVLLTLGGKAELSAFYNEIAGETLTWSSSAPKVVSVDENGCIEALGLGKATITASYGSKKASCAVEVSLSGNVPYLNFESGIDDEITLMKGSEFSLKSYVQFNGGKYYDGIVEYYVADPEVGTMSGDKFVATNKGGSTQVSVFATWRGQTVRAKTLTINVVSESTVLLNGGKLMSLNLYTAAQHAGVNYETSQTISSVYVSEDGVIVNDYDISIADEGIASIERSGSEWTVSANKAGKTNLIVSYGENEYAFDIYVNRPVADVKKFIDYSITDAKYWDEAAQTFASINDSVDGLGEVIAYEYGGKEYKLKGGALQIPVGLTTEVTLYNEAVGYTMNITAYTMILDELQDFTKIYAGTEKTIVQGAYMLAKDIIEPDTVLSMPSGMKPNDFAGTFDGKGHVISFTLVHGTEHAFGIFGEMLHGATIKNLAMSGVKQTGTGGKNPAGVLCAQGSKLTGTPEYHLENLFIDVSFINEGNNFLAVMGNVMWSGILKNVIVHVAEVPKGFESSAFARGSLISSTNSYLISPSPLYEIDVPEKDKPNQAKWVKIVQYSTYEEMEMNGNDYSSFSGEFWDISSGVPVWKTLAANSAK